MSYSSLIESIQENANKSSPNSINPGDVFNTLEAALNLSYLSINGLNLNSYYPQSEFLSKSQARNSVPNEFRRIGIVITYTLSPENKLINERFKGMDQWSTSDSDWEDLDKELTWDSF